MRIDTAALEPYLVDVEISVGGRARALFDSPGLVPQPS